MCCLYSIHSLISVFLLLTSRTMQGSATVRLQQCGCQLWVHALGSMCLLPLIQVFLSFTATVVSLHLISINLCESRNISKRFECDKNQLLRAHLWKLKPLSYKKLQLGEKITKHADMMRTFVPMACFFFTLWNHTFIIKSVWASMLHAMH